MSASHQDFLKRGNADSRALLADLNKHTSAVWPFHFWLGAMRGCTGGSRTKVRGCGARTSLRRPRRYDHVMTEGDAGLLREIKRFVWAAADMELAALAAGTLGMHDYRVVRRLLETSLAVTYVRPFTKNNIGQLGEEYVPFNPRQRALHCYLIHLRNKVYAHSDDTHLRGVADTSKLLGLGEHGYADEYAEIPDPLLPEIERLATGLGARFRGEASLREETLRERGSEAQGQSLPDPGDAI